MRPSLFKKRSGPKRLGIVRSSMTYAAGKRAMKAFQRAERTARGSRAATTAPTDGLGSGAAIGEASRPESKSAVDAWQR